ncbi:hypothetical protein ACNOYE_08280 [Nannocystaceae bacterium ST9]
MKLRTPPILLLLAIFTNGCGDEATGPVPAELAELCGQTDPVQILALDPDRPLARVDDRGIFAGRRVVQVNYRGGPQVLSGFLPSDASELWSVGPCGEDPRLLDDSEAHRILTLDAWPERLLDCDLATGEISMLDPAGVRPTNVVFETDDCFVWPVDDGVLTILPHDETTGTLALLPWPDDPWTATAEPTVILDPVRMQTDSPHGTPEREVLGVTDDDYLAITTDDELVAISRLDATLTPIATGVREFDYHSSGRYVVWQSSEVTSDPDAGWAEGPISLTDRQTGMTTQLTVGALAHTFYDPFEFESAGVLYLRAESNTIDRFYRLPSLESVDVPEKVIVYRVIDDTRVLIGDQDLGTGPFRLFDVLTGESTTLFAGNGSVWGWFDDAAVVLEGVQCCIDDDQRDAGRLWRLPFVGEPELMAERVTVGHRLTGDGRVVTPVDIDDDWVGALVVVDPTTLDERQIDDEVFVFQPSATDAIEGDPVVFYTVADRDRRGVWLARLPHEE